MLRLPQTFVGMAFPVVSPEIARIQLNDFIKLSNRLVVFARLVISLRYFKAQLCILGTEFERRTKVLHRLCVVTPVTVQDTSLIVSLLELGILLNEVFKILQRFRVRFEFFVGPGAIQE